MTSFDVRDKKEAGLLTASLTSFWRRTGRERERELQLHLSRGISETEEKEVLSALFCVCAAAS